MKPKPNIDLTAAKRFLLVRKKLNFNQEEMGEACGISQSAVAKIEGGVLDIPQGAFKMLYVKHNVSPVYVIAGVQPMMYPKTQVSSLVRDIPEMQADIEILKGQIQLLVNYINMPK